MVALAATVGRIEGNTMETHTNIGTLNSVILLCEI